MKRRLTTCLLVLVLLHLILLGETKEKTSEYQLKAVFIANITNFVEWPKGSSINDRSKPIVIGVIGENPFIVKQKGDDTPTNWLEKVYIENKLKIKNKRAEIRNISDITEIRQCNILFVSESEKKMLPEIITAVRKNHVMTFSDTEGFAKKGIHFNLILKSGSVKYEINEVALKESDLKARYQLLKFAEKRVYPLQTRK